MPQMDAIVTAGGIPAPDELLYPYTQGKPKALLPLAGRPMLQWVLDALGAASSVRRVLVVGLTPGLPYRGVIAGVLLTLMAPFMAAIQTIFQASCQRFTDTTSPSSGA